MSIIRRNTLQAIAETEGLAVDKIELRNGGHYKLYLRNAFGEQKVLIASRTPSDHRSSKNLRAEFRRFAQRRVADTQQQHKG